MARRDANNPDTSHLRRNLSETRRLPSYLLEHPHVRAAFDATRGLLPLAAVVLWGSAWWFTPGEYGDYGVLKTQGGGGGRVRFGGMGYCLGEDDCTLALWYQVPREYLPERYPTFLPCLLTLFNLLGAPILFIWWALRYTPRIYPYLRKWYKNWRGKKHDLPLLHVEPFQPNRLFRLATPYIHYALLAWAVVGVGLTVGFFIDVAGETGLGVGLGVTGSGVFVVWRGIEWKWDDWVEAGRYRNRDRDMAGKQETKQFRKETAEV